MSYRATAVASQAGCTVAALTAGVLLFVTGAASASAGVLDAQRTYVLGRMNEERAKAGMGALVASAALTASANRYARLLADRGAMTHVADGTTPTSRAGAAGWPADAQGVGEIIAEAEAAEVTDNWDPAHRVVMMDPLAVVAGVGMADNLWVINFATSCPAGRDAECQLTGELGSTDMDIYRVEAEAANDPFTWRWLCPKMQNPKPAQCSQDNSAGARDGTGTGGNLKSPALRVSTSRNARRITITVSFLSAAVARVPRVTLRAAGRPARTARRVGTAAVSVGSTTVTYRTSVSPGRWSAAVRTEAASGYRAASATRRVPVR